MAIVNTFLLHFVGFIILLIVVLYERGEIMNNSRITEERKKLGLSQEELANKLKISQKSVSKYERGTRRPSYETLVAMSSIFGVTVDYLLGNENGIKSAFGYDGGDENAVSFPHKLANQIDFKGITVKELSDEIGIDEKTVLDWLSGADSGYENYYQELSNFFGVKLRYWTSPHAIAPGIEPSMDEYMLILLYREYKEKGILNELYGSLENFFPGIKIINDSYSEKLLSAFEMLNEDNKDIIIGEVKKCLKEQRYEDSVAAESTMKEAK